MLNLRKFLGLGSTAPPPPSSPPAYKPDEKEFTHLLAARLLFDAPPVLTLGGLESAIASVLPNSEVVQTGEHNFLALHRDHPITDADPRIAAQTLICLHDQTISHDKFHASLAQTFDLPEASALLARSSHELFIAEFMCRSLDPHNRIDLFHAVTSAVIAATNPLIIHSHHADRMVGPAAAARPIPLKRDSYEMPLFFNVRMVRITNQGPGDLIMDTRGLAELGLPDLQVHFRELPPSHIGAHLYNLASYILTNGDCIEDGHTVQGLEPSQKWTCQHEHSLLGPGRIVLDINPGPAHAAGNRR